MYESILDIDNVSKNLDDSIFFEQFKTYNKDTQDFIYNWLKSNGAKFINSINPADPHTKQGLYITKYTVLY